MPAPRNNQNACKWTEDTLWVYLLQIKDMASDKQQLYLGKILEELGLYHDIWGYWVRKFGYDEEIMEEMELIKTMLEANVFRAGLKGGIKPERCIMILKRHYGWSEHGYRADREVAYVAELSDDSHVSTIPMWPENVLLRSA